MNTRSKLTNEEVLHVANLIKVFIDKHEIEHYKKQLNTVLESLDVLDEVDTDKVDITSQVTNLTNVLREDRIEDSLSQEAALQNTKSKKNGYFVVKKVITK